MELLKACSRKLQLLEAAPDERTLRNWKALHYEKLKGNRSHQRSVRINIQWRYVFQLNETTTPPTIEDVAVEDYH